MRFRLRHLNTGKLVVLNQNLFKKWWKSDKTLELSPHLRRDYSNYPAEIDTEETREDQAKFAED
jgi:hypothetical protein